MQRIIRTPQIAGETELTGLGIDYSQDFGIQKPKPLGDQLTFGLRGEMTGVRQGRNIGS